MKLTTVLGLLSVVSMLENINAARILALFIVGSQSHRASFDPMLTKLAERGHHLTVVSYEYYARKPHPNITEITGPTVGDTLNFFPNVFEDRLKTPTGPETFETMYALSGVSAVYLQLPEVKNLINEKFDLIMLDPIATEYFLGFVTHFKVPYIFMSPLPLMAHVITELGIPLLPSVRPYLFSQYSEDMTLWQRFLNSYQVVIDYWRKEVYLDHTTNYYRQTFPEAPSVKETYYGVSAVFQNVHTTLDQPSLSVPGLINTGGMHCRDGKPLPKDLKEYFDGAGDVGVIYFSMGSFAQSRHMPKFLRQIFAHVFGKFKQRVLWKFESDTMDDVDLPPNVRLIKWAPQQDILSHPNLKLVITQGGLMSTQEVVYHSVPTLGIPLIFDQDRNINRLCEMGMALRLELFDVTEETLFAKINQILSDSSFATRANLKGAEFRDHVIKPVDLAVYWVEHVIRHGKTLKLFPLGRKFSIIKFYSLDIIGIIFVLVLTGGIALWICLKVIQYKLKSSSDPLNATNKHLKKQ